MSKHDLKAEKIQVKSLDNRVQDFIEALVAIRMASEEIDLSHPLSLVTKAYVDSVTGDGVPRIAPWDGGATPINYYRTIFIGDIEYQFRSEINDNTTEPTLEGGGVTAWEMTNEQYFPNQYLSSTTYPADIIVWEYDPDFPGDPTKLVAFRSLQAGNVGNPLDFNADTEWWEKLGLYASPFTYVPGNTYGLKDVVVDDTDGNRIYISNIADNNFALDYVIPGTASWQVIGPVGNGSTSLTFTEADLVLVYEGNYSLSFDLPDGKSVATIETKTGTVTKNLTGSMTPITDTANSPDTIISGFDNNSAQTITIKLV